MTQGKRLAELDWHTFRAPRPTVHVRGKRTDSGFFQYEASVFKWCSSRVRLRVGPMTLVDFNLTTGDEIRGGHAPNQYIDGEDLKGLQEHIASLLDVEQRETRRASAPRNRSAHVLVEYDETSRTITLTGLRPKGKRGGTVSFTVQNAAVRPLAEQLEAIIYEAEQATVRSVVRRHTRRRKVP
jgi:hypothetical protein